MKPSSDTMKSKWDSLAKSKHKLREEQKDRFNLDKCWLDKEISEFKTFSQSQN